MTKSIKENISMSKGNIENNCCKIEINFNKNQEKTKSTEEKNMTVKTKKSFAGTIASLGGYAISVFMASLSSLGIIEHNATSCSCYFIYGAIFQFIMSFYEFYLGNHFNFILDMQFGIANAFFALNTILPNKNISNPADKWSTIMFNFSLAFLTLIAFLSSFKKCFKISSLNYLLSSLSFLFSIFYKLTNLSGFNKTSGVINIIATFVTLYILIGLSIDEIYGIKVLPFFN